MISSDGAQTLGQDWWLLLLATLLWYAQAGTLPAVLYFNGVSSCSGPSGHL